MYAVIRTGGKQYRVAEGSVLRVEKLPAAEGETVEFDEVLLLGDGDQVKVGAPLVAGSKVTAKIESHGKGRKVSVVKFRRRKGYKRMKGHRQPYSQVRITAIA